ALNSAPLSVLAQDKTLGKAFAGHSFTAYPPLNTDPEHEFPDLYRQVIEEMPKDSIVVVAVPDPLHYEVIRTALECDQHVCCVKPLVLQYAQAAEIEKAAYEKGLVVGVEYHKRLDDRALMARQLYREGKFGEFRIGHAEMNEPYYYRHSNFQNWFTTEHSDMFTYVGCHYIDQLHFITGLLPKAVSVYGIEDTYPNGKTGYLWTDARVVWENGGCLNVTNVMGYPDEGPGGNFQGIRIYCRGDDQSGMLVHNDQNRGIQHCYVEKGNEPGDTYYAEPSPDYFKYVNLGGEGLTPVGYGYRSIELIVKNICKCIDVPPKALAERQRLLKQFDDEGIMATPANSSYNELVIEAGRLSILNGGREAEISYGENAGVDFRKY
ncbi:MAG: Gfo/Idh/MocA family oxidoreductase, partial [Phycisphaerales bacterium]